MVEHRSTGDIFLGGKKKVGSVGQEATFGTH